MKEKENPTVITSVEEIFKFLLFGSENKLYISNCMDSDIIEYISEYCNFKIEITYIDAREFTNPNLKRNGRVPFKLNKNIIIYKQQYYYMSKGRKKFLTTMVPKHIDKYCNYTRKIKNYRIIDAEIFYSSYENTAESIKKHEKINISRQRVYLYERKYCSSILLKKEEELWNKIKEMGIEYSGYYHYDEEFIKISKKVYVHLTLIDAYEKLIVNDILIPKDEFNKEFVKKFMSDSLEGLPLKCIITDGDPSYPKIIDELDAKHQLCQFHLLQNLMKPLNKDINRLQRKVKRIENKIESIKNEIEELKAEYPYSSGRPPKSDVKAYKNVEKRKKLANEKSELTSEESELKKIIKACGTYKDQIKPIFKVKTLDTAKNKINRIMGKEDVPDVIYDFLKKLLKKIDRAVLFVNENNIPKTNNLVELYYRVTFPGKIKRIFRTYEGAMNRIRLNNIRWMERNVLGEVT